MAITKIEREVLEEAREQLRLKFRDSICGALIRYRELLWRFPVQSRMDHRNAAEKLRRYFQDSLGEHSYLEYWQEANGFPDRSEKQLRQDRIDWINWVLKEND